MTETEELRTAILQYIREHPGLTAEDITLSLLDVYENTADTYKAIAYLEWVSGDVRRDPITMALYSRD